MGCLLLVVSVACACACARASLAEGAVSNRNTDRETGGATTGANASETDVADLIAGVAAPSVVAPTDERNATQNASAAPLPIQCTANREGVTFSIEKCKETNKTILEVTVHDSYKARVPTEPSPTRAPVTEFTPTEPESIEETYDDYPFFAEDDVTAPFYSHSVDARAAHLFMLSQRRREFFPFRRRVEITPRRTTTARPSPIEWNRPFAVPPHLRWVNFCKKAANEDEEEPFRLPDSGINPEYEALPGLGFYRFHAAPRTWEQARRACEREGAHLAVLNSQAEAHALQDMHNRCPNVLQSHFNDYQYLGVHDQFGEGDWITVFGEKLNETGYVKWARNQPDNAHVHGENCLTMNRWANFNDVPCSTELPFTCEHL